jgi:hypothetical protein
MDMDPMTRREADKVESILVDLAEELRLLSLLPEEFSSWVRDEMVVAAMGEECSTFLHLYEAHAERKAAEKGRETQLHAAVNRPGSAGEGGGHLHSHHHSGVEKVTAPPTAFISAQLSNSADSLTSSSTSAGWAELQAAAGGGADALSPSALTPEDEEERQRSIKGACFVHTAAQFGDPTDGDGNEAVVQVSDFAQLERALLNAATTTGCADPSDIQVHHLSTRALVDTLREGGYDSAMHYFLRRLYPSSRAAQPTTTRRKDHKTKTATTTGAADASDLVQMHVYGCGLVEEGLDHLRQLVATLYRLIHERNQSTVNEDIHRYQLLHDAVNKDQAGTADVQVLNQRFLDVKAARQREVAELDDEIQQLEKELQYVRQAADVELEAFQRVQETIQNDHRCTLRQQLEAHRSAAEAVAQKLQQAQAKDLDELSALRSQRTKREAAVSGAIADYDAQTAQLEAAMRLFNQEAEEDTERIVRLEAEVQSLQKQRDEHAWELTVAEQRQEHAHVIRQRQEQDARVIQAYYRAFHARLQAQQALEKGTKKGKKGGAKVK